MLFNITSNKWDKDILKIFKLNEKILPTVKNSADDFGFTSEKIVGQKIKISAVLGDQQAAAIGQACFEKGSVKSTYGTGAFLLMNTGEKKIMSKSKLITTICYRINNKTTYALEGSIFIAGAGVQWLRDKIRLIDNAYETEKIAKSKKNSKGVYVVPAFTGLGAPYWNSKSRGLITGLTRDSDWRDLVRATIESVAYQTSDLNLILSLPKSLTNLEEIFGDIALQSDTINYLYVLSTTKNLPQMVIIPMNLFLMPLPYVLSHYS